MQRISQMRALPPSRIVILTEVEGSFLQTGKS